MSVSKLQSQVEYICSKYKDDEKLPKKEKKTKKILQKWYYGLGGSPLKEKTNNLRRKVQRLLGERDFSALEEYMEKKNNLEKSYFALKRIFTNNKSFEETLCERYSDRILVRFTHKNSGYFEFYINLNRFKALLVKKQENKEI